MPIEPIQLPGFTRNATGVESILARGTSAFASILQGAIQTGRDQANNQAGQERDFLTERKRVDDLMARRGETLLQQENLNRRFTEDVRQFGVKFGQGERKFDAEIRNANLNREITQQNADTSARDVNSNIARDERLIKDAETRAYRDAGDEPFRRAEMVNKGKSAELQVQYDEAKLNELQRNQATAKSPLEIEKAQREFGEAQDGVLATMDEKLRGEDKEEARSFFRTVFQNPKWGIPTPTVSRTAKELGIEQQGGSSTTGKPAPDKPLAEWTDDQVETEYNVLTRAVRGGTPEQSGTQVEGLDQKAALKLSAVRTERDKRKKGPNDWSKGIK